MRPRPRDVLFLVFTALRALAACTFVFTALCLLVELQRGDSCWFMLCLMIIIAFIYVLVTEVNRK